MKQKPNQPLQTMTAAVTCLAAHSPHQLRSCLIYKALGEIMKKLLLLLLIGNIAIGAPQAVSPKDGALILVDGITSITSEDPVATYGISPAGLLDIKKDPKDLFLKDYGKKEEGFISVSIIGAIHQPGRYFIKNDASIADLISNAQGLPRLATSKFILRRGDTIFRIYVGRGHTVSPAAKDILPLLLLKDGDVLWVSEPTPL